MADDLGFVPSKSNDIGFIPSISSPDNLGFVAAKSPVGATPLKVNQSPESFEQAGPATPQPITGEHPIDTLETWLMKAMSAPGTFIGRLLSPTPQPGKPITPGGINVSGAEDPFIDPSVSMDPSVAKGIVKAAGGMSSINNMMMAAAPFGSMGTGISRGMSGVFAANTVPQLWQQYSQYAQLKQDGQDKEAETVLGEMLGTFGMGSLALYHAGGFGGKEGKLTIEDEHSLTGILAKQLEQAARNGDHAGVQDVLDAFNESTPEHGKRLLANIAAIADKLEERKNAGTDLGTPITETEKNITPLKGDDTTGPVSTTSGQIEQPPQAPQFAEENLRDNSRDTGGEGAVGGATEAGPINQGDEGAASQGASQGILDASISQLKAIYPQYAHIIGGGEGTAPAIRLEQPSEGKTGELHEPEGAGAIPPVVISREIDNDLANGGIHIVERGKDIGYLSRWLGGLAETARQLNNSGHPLGPILTSMAAKMSDVTKSIVTNQMDTMRDYVTGAKKYVSRDEWSNQVVPLMEGSNGNVPIGPRPANVPQRIWDAYQVARGIDDRLRVGIRDARRKELAFRGIDPAAIQKWIPDDWGMDNHYHHSFPGTWAIVKEVGANAKGMMEYEPIETGWRAESRADAVDKATEYLKNNPSANIKIEQDTITLPGKNLADRTRLIDLAREIKDASATYANGGDPADILKQLYAEAGAKAFGPRQIASRQLGAALERESNLPGWVKDRDNFESYLMATERYIQLAPARQLLMKARNAIASLAGMPAAQRIGEFPPIADYENARQYGNILARVDSAIEGLEGKPGLTDAITRSVMNKLGWDPNTVNNLYRPLQSVMALVKLGFNPARVLSHGLQSLWAVYPVLGEKATLQGMAHSYSGQYDWLIKDLAITHGVNASEIEGMHSYIGNYFGHGSTPLDWTKGTTSILKDVGMLPFTTGIDFTRRTAAIGAYTQAIERGMTPENARNYARDILDRTTGNYTPSDNSAFLRQLPGPVSQFKNFMLKTMQFTTGLRGPEIARFMAAIGVIGFTGFPALRSILNLAYNITGEDVETDIKRQFPVSSRGVFGLLGMDVPSGVGLGDLSISRENTPLGGLGGPALSDAIATGNALAQRVLKGQSREAQNNLDTAIRNISPEARRIYDEATRISTGRPYLIDPRTGAVILSDLSTQERAEMFAGITPLRVAEERDAHEYIRNQVAQAKDKRGYLVDRLAELQVDLSRPNVSEADRMNIMRQTSAYIQAAQDNGLGLHLTKAVIQRAKEMQVERLTRDIKLAPKPQKRLAYEEMNRFKGEQ